LTFRAYLGWAASSKLANGELRSPDKLKHVPQKRPAQAILTLFLLLLTAGCGYIGQPLVPLANVPQRISDLAAVQRGSTIIAHFTIPTFTTENNQ
jgi:hypothetical protein